MAGFMSGLFGPKPKKRVVKEKTAEKAPIIIKEKEPVEFPEIPDYTPELEKIDASIKEAKLETLDAIHQENVRVYRNVQAVVVDETARVRKAVDAANASVKRKAVTSLVFSILSFSFTVLILIFLILDKVGLF